MTAKQLQRLLDGMKISQRGAAKAIGISERQMRRYCAGDAKIPVTVECALMWVRAAGREAYERKLAEESK
jgi:plasmid maintenance system antidote protein VapI